MGIAMLSKKATASFDAPHPAALWVESVPLDPLQVDCVTTQMLTILDNQCKLGLEQQLAMMAMYSVVRARNGLIFDQTVHQTIDKARAQDDPRMAERVHELRLYAEQRIPKQVMRHFKRFLSESLDGFCCYRDSANSA